MNKIHQMRYNSAAQHFKELFGGRAQKLSIDAGFTCPNRDGRKGTDGCAFCNNEAFNPSYCREAGDISVQIDEGIRFHRWRYRNSACYLAYFQTYSNTYASLDVLRQRYEKALSHPLVSGIVIGTRPDCVDDEKLDYIASLKERTTFVSVEYGVESCYDRTLETVGRGHDFATAKQAIEATSTRGIHCGAHFILGLPGECRDEMVAMADIINMLPLNAVKFHQLQYLIGTRLAEMACQSPEKAGTTFRLDEYIALVCDIVERLRPGIAIERFAGEVPPRYQAFPERAWRRPDGRLVRNEEIGALVEAELSRRGSFQGWKLKSVGQGG